MATYHPDFFKGGRSHRHDCRTRLDCISKYIEDNTQILDIGCSGGYYSFGLSQRANNILAVDTEQNLINECNNIKERNDVTNVEFKVANIMDYIDSVDTEWDVILYLSTHHHVIGNYGFEKAATLMRTLSERTSQMFFDMGQKNEKGCTGHYWWNALPSLNGKDQDTWLRDYISENTEFTDLEIIGTSPIHKVTRSLWKLEK